MFTFNPTLRSLFSNKTYLDDQKLFALHVLCSGCRSRHRPRHISVVNQLDIMLVRSQNCVAFVSVDFVFAALDASLLSVKSLWVDVVALAPCCETRLLLRITVSEVAQTITFLCLRLGRRKKLLVLGELWVLGLLVTPASIPTILD